MKNYINTFNTFDDIDDALSTSQLNAPYVAYAEGEDKVYMGTSFNGWSGWTGFYNIQDISQATKIANTNPTEISIDNGEWVAYTNTGYTFATTGVHKVGFKFNTNTPSFQNCTSLTKIRIPEGVTVIGQQWTPAFLGCTALATVKFPGSLIKIENNAFNGCTSLTGLTIPESLTTLASNVFRGCNSLEYIIFLPDTPPTFESGTFDNTATIYVPDASVEDYKTAANWSDYASRIKTLSEFPA